MKLSIFGIVCVVIASLLGCEDTDSIGEGDAQSLEELGKAKQKVTVCDFGSTEIVSGESYSVSIKNKDIKDDKDYLVEVAISGTTQSISGDVKEKGTMFVTLVPFATGDGTVRVFETKTKKDKVEKKLKAQCSFVAVDDRDGGGDSDADADADADSDADTDTGGEDDQCIPDKSVCDYDPTTEPEKCGYISTGCGTKRWYCGDCDGDDKACDTETNTCKDCTPNKTCESVGAKCGPIDNGCKRISCGMCDEGQSCNDNYQCVDCVPETCETVSGCDVLHGCSLFGWTFYAGCSRYWNTDLKYSYSQTVNGCRLMWKYCSDFEERVFEEINKNRLAAGVHALERSSDLDATARQWCKTMARKSWYPQRDSTEKGLYVALGYKKQLEPSYPGSTNTFRYVGREKELKIWMKATADYFMEEASEKAKFTNKKFNRIGLSYVFYENHSSNHDMGWCVNLSE